MRLSKSLPEAMQFESLKTPKEADGVYTTRLYAVKNMPGVWRRIASNVESEGISAQFDGVTITLERAVDVEKELALAGFPTPPHVETPQDLFDEKKTETVGA